jgi:hypothetical protein
MKSSPPTALPGSSHWGAWLVGFVYPLALLIAFVALASCSLVRKSITFDELGHITGGYTSWVTGDHRFFPQNGQFPKQWATWPLLFQELKLPPTDQPAWRDSNVEEFGYQFLYAQGNDLHALLNTSRMMMVLVGLLLCGVVYIWSRLLFGPAGANVSLTLCVFSPAMLAHARLVTSDIAAALMFTLSLFLIWSLLLKVTLWRVLGCAGSLGLLCVTKMSALIMGPVIAVLVVIRLLLRRPLLVAFRGRQRVIRRGTEALAVLSGAFAIVLLTAWTIIWAFYGFRYSTVRDEKPDSEPAFFGETINSLTEGNPVGPVIRFARDHNLLPESYLFGFAHVLSHSRAHPAFLNGNYSPSGWTSFLPITVMLKTPIPVFLVALLALWAACARLNEAGASRRWARFRRAMFRTAPLWVFLAVYWIVAVQFHLSIGERHVLPTYPAAFVLCGAAGYWFHRSRVVKVWVVALLAWVVFESILIWPHYLAYFNQAAGGPKYGYRHLVDSSLDWGQDLIGLKHWIETRSSHGGNLPIYLGYFGTGDPRYYGITAESLPGYLDFQPRKPYLLKPGIYCISATILQSLYNPVWGHWNERYERSYREHLATFRNQQHADVPANPTDLARQWWELEHLRLARLCAYLRTREPDDNVGYSILIYRVSDRELKIALGVN